VTSLSHQPRSLSRSIDKWTMTSSCDGLVVPARLGPLMAPPHDHTAEATEHEDRDATTEQREDRSLASGGAALRRGAQNDCGNSRFPRRSARHRIARGPPAIPCGPFGRGSAGRGRPSRAPARMDARSERRGRGGARRGSACLARLIEGQRVFLGRGRAWIDVNARFQASGGTGGSRERTNGDHRESDGHRDPHDAHGHRE
jgi:hypothetical protein